MGIVPFSRRRVFSYFYHICAIAAARDLLRAAFLQAAWQSVFETGTGG